MLTLATVKVVDRQARPAEEYEIDVDVDDSGWAYIKQGDDWVAFPVKYTDRIIAALNNVRRE